MNQQLISHLIHQLKFLPPNTVHVANNRIKVTLLWQTHEDAMSCAKVIGQCICPHITINHYVHVRYIMPSALESEDRVCIFPPHRAPIIETKGEKRDDKRTKTPKG